MSSTAANGAGLNGAGANGAALPGTPDFDVWAVEHAATELAFTPDAVDITWSDGASSRHHALLLRENSPDDATIHRMTREMCLLPTAIPDDLSITAAYIANNGAVAVSFSDGTESAFHPGWLRGTAWLGKETPPHPPILWRSEDLPAPPAFDGPEALENPAVFLQWLEALRDYGVARLYGLPQRDGLLEEIVTRIGPVRESNFGRQFVLDIKDDPDSQAYTSDMLPQHMDLATRECPPGLQFLYTRENTVVGGEGTYVDAYRIAEDMREEEPEHFRSLTEDAWEFTNRAKDSDYRWRAPTFDLDEEGRIVASRFSSFLRAPMRAPLETQARAYKAFRAFTARAQSERYMMVVRYQPGDLLGFDNRRALHGRRSYETTTGGEKRRRFIEGLYSDRDDLHSRIRILQREMRRSATRTASAAA